MDLGKLGEFIAKLRKEKHYTQEQLGEILHVNSKNISKWERGVNAPDISLIVPISKALDVSPDELLNCHKDDSSNSSIDTIFYYNKQSKKKYFKYCVIILTIILIVFTSILLTFKYNEFNIFRFENSEGIYTITGYFGYNHSENIIMIDKIIFDDIYSGTDKEPVVDSFSLSLELNGEIIYNNEYTLSKNDSFSDIINNITLLVNSNDYNYNFKPTKNNKLLLHINTYNKELESSSTSINLELNKKL